MVSPIDVALNRLLSSKLATKSSINGCSSRDIEVLENVLSIDLPAVYREFLLKCGNAAGKFLVGTDWAYPKLVGLQTLAERLLRDCNKSTDLLGLRPFVFVMHQGYQFLYFNCLGTEDPEILRFEEGDTDVSVVFDSFSSWFAQCVADEIALNGKIE